MKNKLLGFTYRWRTPTMASWRYVWCDNMEEAKSIVRGELGEYADGFRMPRGTIFERVCAGPLVKES